MNYNDLSDEQQGFIEKVRQGNNVLVDACIGSGKTTAIQILCDEMEDKKILYLTYNKLLKIDAKDKIRNRNVLVQNYHGLAYLLLRNKGISVGIPDLIGEFNKTFSHESITLGQHFDLLVLDEYQDLESELATMIDIIKTKNPGIQLVAVGDMKQKIYDKTSLDVPDFMSSFLGDYDLIHFTKCFRLNQRLASQLGGVWDKEINGVNPNCEVLHMSFDDAKRYIMGCNTEDVLCLGSRTGQMSRLLNRLESENPNKFNKTSVYASISDNNKGSIDPTKDSAIFTTYDSSKGLEKPICFLFDYTENYWYTRAHKSMTDTTILRNIFCVAASRGKNKIIMVEPDGSEKMLTPPVLSRNCAMNTAFGEGFNISEMFDFKYKEDVERCFKLLTIRKIKTEDKSVIDVPSQDGLIDISPCIGNYQEALYFNNYDIDQTLTYAMDTHKNRPRIKYDDCDSLEQKILLLTAFETEQNRYIDQTNTVFISEVQKAAIINRLSSRLTPDEDVQEKCVLPFYDSKNKAVEIKGRMDVVKGNTIYELKFVSELSHEQFLQLACYLVATKKKRGILWNVKNNSMYEVSINDKNQFMDAVVKTITKGVVTRYKKAPSLGIDRDNQRAPRSPFRQSRPETRMFDLD